MTRKEIIRVLEEIADLLEFNGENVFKVNAFRNGANSIRRFEGDFELLVEEKKLNSVKGVGTALQSVIHDLYRNGISSLLSELKKELPEGIHELFKIKGIGPKKVKQLFSELNINSIADLENGCINNKLITIKGFTQKTTENILAEIEKYKENQKYLLLSDALKIVDNIKLKLNDVKFDAFEVTGELRRRREIVSKIEFLVAGDFEKISFTIKNVFNNVNKSEKNISVADFQIPIIFHYSIENDFTRDLLITTGSREFLEFYKIDEFSSSEKSEHQIFQKMKISYHAPVLREKEFVESNSRVPNENELIQISDLKGFLHFHTNYSDGMNSIAEMVLSAKEFGYNYFAVCDHSKSAFYANGLSEDRIFIQNKELTKVSSENSLNILQGIEVDILQSGELDYDSDFMENFDFVVASVHSS
ncbi:MAG: PHP domain-containing protein, partial [Ignavibacteriaceae bacterium]|nr:PHP domain-containing protein [Ignavibacteriaceae bacterium]